MIPKDQPIINFDIDGTLTKTVCWTPEEVLNAEINTAGYALIKHLYKTKFIVVYTARRDELIPTTLEWLRKNDVPFHAISNNKIPGYYVDDNCFNIKDCDTVRDIK